MGFSLSEAAVDLCCGQLTQMNSRVHVPIVPSGWRGGVSPTTAIPPTHPVLLTRVVRSVVVRPIGSSATHHKSKCSIDADRLRRSQASTRT